MTAKKYKAYLLTVDDLEIPVKIYKERRNSIRASLAKDHAILRLPLFLSQKGEQEQIDRFYFWLKEKVLSKDRFRTQFTGKNFTDGYQFTLYDKSFSLRLIPSTNKSHSAKYLGNNEIGIKLAYDANTKDSASAITSLISRIIAQLYQKDMERRVRDFNNRFFKMEVKSVNLKYNRSNWGSCSSSSNINFSTRLLFAPLEVQNYVIIHELAHLKELNHSDRFWSLVANAMPEYKIHEKWLKKNGHLCDFGL